MRETRDWQKGTMEMTARKILTVVLGVLMIVGGIYCMFTPAATYMALGFVVGFNMLLDGIGNIAMWSQEHKAGRASGWHLAAAIISLVFGIVLLASTSMQAVVDIVIAYMVATWLVFMGVDRIVLSVRMRKVHKTLDTPIIGKRWWLVLIMGILMLVCGAVSIFDPTALALTIGVSMGIAIVVSGASLISVATA